MGLSVNQILKSSNEPSLAFVFPGQGSQKLGMLGEWGDNPVIRKTFDEASEALGYNVWELAQMGPEAQLNQTEYTQPALLTAGVALFRMWRKAKAYAPNLLAGHSLGEYTALVSAEAMSLAEGVCLVAERGRLMQAAVPEGVGAMAAIIGLSDEQVIELCKTVNHESRDCGSKETVEPANFNAPLQVVIAGHTAAITRAMETAKKMGAKRAIALAVSVPSHCSLMKPACRGLAEALDKITLKMPKIPVLHNVDVTVHDSLEGIRNALISQLESSVRWSESIQKMTKNGIKTVLECGPGSVLTGLNKRIEPTLTSASISEILNKEMLKEAELTD